MGLLDDLSDTLEPKLMAAGHKPGKGIYICQNCKQALRLENENDILPTCPKCEHTLYI